MTANLKEGDKAPAFELARDGGGSVSLKSLAGKKIVLYFYPKNDTTGCTKEAIDFSGLKKNFARVGAEVIGVSPDSVKSHDKFKAKHELDLTLLSDETKKMLADYGVWAEKSMYGRKYMGVERSTFLIDADGRIAEVWRKVRLKGHVDAVLKAAKSLRDASRA